ncbi:CAP domain-containing protein [Nocardia goodfellowii]
MDTAQAHSADLGAHPGLWERKLDGFPGRYGSDGRTFQDRITRAMGSDGNENVYIEWFFGQVPPPDVQRAFDSWKHHSFKHRETILNRQYRCAGVGVGTGVGTVPGTEQAGTFHYYVMNFHAAREIVAPADRDLPAVLAGHASTIALLAATRSPISSDAPPERALYPASKSPSSPNITDQPREASQDRKSAAYRPGPGCVAMTFDS